MNETSLDLLRQMKFYGMYDTFRTSIEGGRLDSFTIDEFVALLVQAEWDDRQNRKTNRLIHNARFRYKAAIEQLDFDANRNLDKNRLIRYAQCDFIKKKQNILITGSTGIGKSFIASAIGHQACMLGFKVMYFSTSRLFAKLKMAKADGSYIKEITRIERMDLLILDDFGIQPMDNQSRLSLLEIIEDRHGQRSTIITSQLPVKQWYEVIGEKTIADAVLDRIVHDAHRLELKGESLRKRQAKPKQSEEVMTNN